MEIIPSFVPFGSLLSQPPSGLVSSHFVCDVLKDGCVGATGSDETGGAGAISPDEAPSS